MTNECFLGTIRGTYGGVKEGSSLFYSLFLLLRVLRSNTSKTKPRLRIKGYRKLKNYNHSRSIVDFLFL